MTIDLDKAYVLQDMAYRDYQNLHTIVSTASESRIGTASLRVLQFMRKPDANPVYCESLMTALQRRALTVLHEAAPSFSLAPRFASHYVESVTETVLSVVDEWETMVNNVSDEG